MTTRTDAKFAALRGQGHTGAMSDMTLAWLQANGAATSSAVVDAWAEMLESKGYGRNDGYPSVTDGWFHLLGSLGYTGGLPDRELAFWVAGGTFV